MARFITLFGIIFAGYCFFCSQTTVSAEEATPYLLINEVYYDTIGVDSEEEWVELYNPSSFPVNLSGFYLGSENDDDYQIVADLEIEPEGYLIIASDNDGFHNLYDKNPDLSGWSLSLANSGDYIALFDSGRNIIDSVVWEDANYEEVLPHPGARTDQSIERKSLDIDSDNCEDDFRVLEEPLPWSQYILPVYSSDIMISEIMPWPEEGSSFEFIELYNLGTTTVDLSGWQLDDTEDSGSSPYAIADGIKIEPEEYLAFYNIDTKISLNDDGDTARLLDPSLKEISKVSYLKSPKGQSYSLINNNWLWSESKTPNLVNAELVVDDDDVSEETDSLISDVEENAVVKKVSISEGKKQENGTIITVEGNVTVLPGMVSTQYFYIEDDASGIQVYLSSKDFPDLTIGDIIEVTGELSERSGERRIKIDSPDKILVLERGYQRPDPIPIEISEIGEQNEGRLVEISGEVVETSGDIFVVKSINSGQTVKVVIRETTEIDKPRMRTGDIVEVSGVISQYKEEYRILPIEQEDVKIISLVELPRAGPDIIVYFFIILVVLLLWNTFLIVKNKLIKSPKT